MRIINSNAVKKLFPFIIPIIPFLIALNHGVYSLALFPGLFVLVVVLYCPFIAFLSHVFFFYHPIFALMRTITGSLALISFWIYWLIEKKQLIIDFTSFLFIASLITMFLSGMINESLPGNSSEAIRMGFFYIFMYTLMLNIINSKEKLRTLIIFIIFLCVLLSFLAFLEFLFKVDLLPAKKMSADLIPENWIDFRPNGTQRDPDEMSMMLLFGLPLVVGMALHVHNIIWKRSLFFIAIFVTFGMAIGFSRAAFISLIFSILLFFFYNAKLKHLKYYILLLIFLGILLQSNSGILIQRFKGLSHFGDLETWSENTISLHIRYLQYQAFGVLFKEYPIFGIGPGNFLTKTDNYDLGFITREESINNLFMSILLDSGIIGLSVYILLLLIAWKNLVKSQKIVQERNDLEMLYYIRSVKYSFFACFLDLQATHAYFAFPIFMSIGLSGAINQIVSSSTQVNDHRHSRELEETP